MVTTEHVTLILLIGVAFTLGKMWQAQQAASRDSHLAIMAALHACAEARGLKNSTVIQRIVEKIHPIKERSEEALKEAEELNEAFEQMANPEGDTGFDFMNQTNLRMDANLGRGDLDPDELV